MDAYNEKKPTKFSSKCHIGWTIACFEAKFTELDMCFFFVPGTVHRLKIRFCICTLNFTLYVKSGEITATKILSTRNGGNFLRGMSVESFICF